MPATVEEHSKFWEEKWKERTAGEKVQGNQAKVYALVTEILSRGGLTRGQKLDIGCGPGLHAHGMSLLIPSWGDSWTGIDLSETAIAKAKSFGLNASVDDIYEYDGNNKKYDLFFLFDTLEHLFDHERLGGKIKSLGAGEYTVLGNVPLYPSDNEDCERSVDVKVVARFLEYAGCTGGMFTKIYGINGFPYMIFEGSSTGKIRNIVKEIVKAVSTVTKG